MKLTVAYSARSLSAGVSPTDDKYEHEQKATYHGRPVGSCEAFGDILEMKALHLVLRDQNGLVVCHRIGQAIVAASVDETPTPSAIRGGLLSLASYHVHSPSEAAEAMRELADLGDVDFDESDF